MIAIALSCNSSLLIADEPTTALDVTIQAQILELMSELKRKFGTAIMFITHDLGVVAEIARRVIVMYAGKIVEQAPVADIFESPCHPYTEALLSSVPMPDPKILKKKIMLPGDVPSPINPPSGCVFHPRCPHRRVRCETVVPEYVEIEPDHWLSCHYPIN